MRSGEREKMSVVEVTGGEVERNVGASLRLDIRGCVMKKKYSCFLYGKGQVG